MRGLVTASLPGLTRQSITYAKSLSSKMMDARIKSGHDDLEGGRRQNH